MKARHPLCLDALCFICEFDKIRVLPGGKERIGKQWIITS